MTRILWPVAAIPAIILLSALLAVLSAPRAQAGGPTFVVDTLDDDASAAKAVCSGAADDCSLRGAITTANSSPTTNVIELGTNQTYLLDEGGVAASGDDANMKGDLDVLAPIVLNGNGSTVDANGIDRVFDLLIGSSDEVDFNGVTITGGNVTSILPADAGGGIRVADGQLTLTNTTVTGNASNTIGLAGAGILSGPDADVDINQSEVSSNTATNEFGAGGGFARPDGAGSIEVRESRFNGNIAGSTGGGLYIGLSTAGASIHDSDLTNNVANVDCSPAIGCAEGGGAVYAGAESITFIGGSVSNNHAPNASAGGAYVPEIHVQGTTFSGNTAAGDAGAIYSFESLSTIEDAVIANNQAGASGGLIYAGSMINSTVSGNVAAGDAGGMFGVNQPTVVASTFSGNTAAGEGGAILFSGDAPTITNSTISGNTAASGGGIARSATSPDSLGTTTPQGNGPPPVGPLTISHTTIANNTAAIGANIKPFAAAGDTIVHATIIADPVAGPNCSGALLSDGYNVEDADTCGLTGFNDAVNADPLLQPLADNGGPTLTQALADGSPAIDRALVCPPPATDQTGDSRPKGNACDSGAFESDFTAPTASPTPTGGPTETPTAEPTTATPTSSATSTATPTATPAVTPSGTPQGEERIWGDSDCDGEVTSRDNQALLRNVLSQAPLSQTEPCPDLGHVLTEPPSRTWGDWDCDGEITSRDNQALLRNVLSQAPLSQTQPCTAIGDSVAIAG